MTDELTYAKIDRSDRGPRKMSRLRHHKSITHHASSVMPDEADVDRRPSLVGGRFRGRSLSGHLQSWTQARCEVLYQRACLHTKCLYYICPLAYIWTNLSWRRRTRATHCLTPDPLRRYMSCTPSVITRWRRDGRRQTVDITWPRPPSPSVVNDRPTNLDRLSHSATVAVL